MKLLNFLFFLLLLIFYGCIFCAFSSAEIENHNEREIYVIIKFDSLINKNKKIDFCLHFEGTKYADIIGKDTVNSIYTYRVKKEGNLTLYEGPGSKPKYLMNSIEIVSDKQILKLRNKKEIADAFDDMGMKNILEAK